MNEKDFNKLLELVKGDVCQYYFDKKERILVNLSDDEIVDEYIELVNSTGAYGKDDFDYEDNAARYYAEKKDYENAILIFKVLEAQGYENANNNLGVCYERCEKYDDAYTYYSKSEEISYLNIIKLYYNGCIKFNYSDYMKYIEVAKRLNDDEAYYYLSRLYAGNMDKTYKDNKKAFDTLIEGSIAFPGSKMLKTEIGYALEKGEICEENQYLSHVMYSQAVSEDSPVALYNYALQCFQGRGCKVNLDEAKMFALTASAFDYIDALSLLVRIASRTRDGELLKLSYQRYEEIKNDDDIGISKLDYMIKDNYEGLVEYLGLPKDHYSREAKVLIRLDLEKGEKEYEGN